MPSKPKPEPQETHTTDKGLQIPVPSREDFLRDLGKVAPPVKPEPGQDERDKRD